MSTQSPTKAKCTSQGLLGAMRQERTPCSALQSGRRALCSTFRGMPHPPRRLTASRVPSEERASYPRIGNHRMQIATARRRRMGIARPRAATYRLHLTAPTGIPLRQSSTDHVHSRRCEVSPLQTKGLKCELLFSKSSEGTETASPICWSSWPTMHACEKKRWACHPHAGSNSGEYSCPVLPRCKSGGPYSRPARTPGAQPRRCLIQSTGTTMAAR